MEYRVAKKSDLPQITDLCEKYNIAVPENPLLLFVSVDENGKINNMIGLKQYYQIEPLIAENAIAGDTLYKMMDGVIQVNKLNPVRALVDKKNEKYIKTLLKVGFQVKETEKIILEK